jgi:threonine/homoserine/homoserine lactone efflux protein
MELLLFLLQVFVISLSGALAPGPVTAAAIAMGARNRFAGTLMAIGHGIIEFPLIVLIILGADRILKSTPTRIGIGLAGGTVLVIMGIQMLRGLTKEVNQEPRYARSGPLAAGILLSGGNPYFLLWWATVGLTLATRARGLGVWAFALFAVVHWSCDLIWLSALSWASFKGTVLLGPWVLRVVLLICSVFLLVFGAYYLIDAGGALVGLLLAGGH